MRKSILRVLSVMVIFVLLLGMLPFAAFAEGTEASSASEKQTAYFAAPALFADAGETIDLSDCSVMFDVKTVTDASKITWTSEEIAISDGKVTPAAKGVYALTAAADGKEKTVYLIVKNTNETEYVLYELDPSAVEKFADTGCSLMQIKDGRFTYGVANGKVALTAAAANKNLAIALPLWLADFGDYSFEVDMAMTNRYNPTRWVALAHRIQTATGNVPYQVFTTRTDANTNTNTSGVEISRTTLDGASWHKEFSANTSFAIYNNGDHHYRLDAYGSHLTASIDDSVIHDNDYPAHNTTGGLGIVACGVTVEISKMKVTLDRARLDALYGNLSVSGIHAVAGEKIDLSIYSVLHKEISAIAGDRLTWSSADMTVTNNKVTPEAPGTYTLSVVAANPPKNRNGNVEENFANEVSLIVDAPEIVKQASALIDAIGEVTADSKSAIEAARTAYDALEDQQKEWVENYAVLEAAEAAYQVIVDKAAAKAVDDLIAAIGEVTNDSKDDIDAARAAYNALTDTQKGYVTLLAVLESAENTYQSNLSDQQRAKEVDEIIDSIGTVSVESGALIQAAREAYDALNDNQKTYVTKLFVLEAAEAAYAVILADQAAAKAVDDLIATIGEVTEESKADIEAARDAYDGLTDAQKAYVTKLSVLEAAEQAYQAILDDQATAKAVDDLIDAIGEVTEESGDQIDAARAAYNALTDAQKAYVTKLSALEEVEVVYNAILEQKNGVKKVYFAAPAIFANAGIEVDLSEYSVMFDAYHMTDASKIEWSSDAVSIENDKIDPEKGVYQLTAKSKDAEKTVYLVVKEPAEKEYVLYEKDFADVESFEELEKEGYFIAQKDATQSVSVADGQLVLDGKAVNKNLRVLLPWWLADFGDYTFEANVSFNDVYNSNRWFALSYRTQRGSEAYPYIPYQVFTIRADSHTNKSGVEFCRTTATDTWTPAYPAKNTFNIYQNGDHLYKVQAYGTHQIGSIDGSVLHNSEYPAEFPSGGLGFVAGGSTIAVSDLKITLDPKAIEKIYENVIYDTQPVIYAESGQEIDLSQYSVMYNSGSVIGAENLVWSSEDLAISGGKVTPAKAGIYKVTAKAKNEVYNINGTAANLSRTVLLMVDAKITSVESPESNLVMPASVITYINSKADLDAITAYETAPATAVLRLNKKLEVVDASGKVIIDLDTAIKALGNHTMPAFYVSQSKTVDRLCEYVLENAVIDAFVVARDGDLLQRVHEQSPILRCVLDLSGKALKTPAEARDLTNKAKARTCILPAAFANKANTEALQRLLMTVWVTAKDATPSALVGAVTTGANGIITQDVDGLMDAYTTYFESTTITRAPALIGHRGSPSLGQPNTVDGSMKAYEAGATAIENDIYITTDGVIVVMHDATIDATTNGSGKVENMTYAQLQQYHVDANANAEPQPIPTLEDYFKAFKGLDVQIVVEIKSTKVAICQALADLIEEYDIADQINIISFTGSQLLEMKRIMPEISVGWLTSNASYENAPEASIYNIMSWTQNSPSTFNPQFTKGPMGEKVLTAAHQRGIGIHLWTVNNKADQNFYFVRGGDSLTTDNVQYFADTVKSLSADQSVYRMGYKGAEIELFAKTYDRGAASLDGIEMKVIEGDDVFTYADGKITASADGTATVIFTLPCKTSDGRDYFVTTEVVTLIAENVAAGDVDGADGITTADAVLLMQYLLGKTEAVIPQNCDADSDGAITVADVIRILRRCAE